MHRLPQIFPAPLIALKVLRLLRIAVQLGCSHEARAPAPGRAQTEHRPGRAGGARAGPAASGCPGSSAERPVDSAMRRRSSSASEGRSGGAGGTPGGPSRACLGLHLLNVSVQGGQLPMQLPELARLLRPAQHALPTSQTSACVLQHIC